MEYLRCWILLHLHNSTHVCCGGTEELVMNIWWNRNWERSHVVWLKRAGNNHSHLSAWSVRPAVKTLADCLRPSASCHLHHISNHRSNVLCGNGQIRFKLSWQGLRQWYFIKCCWRQKQKGSEDTYFKKLASYEKIFFEITAFSAQLHLQHTLKTYKRFIFFNEFFNFS